MGRKSQNLTKRNGVPKSTAIKFEWISGKKRGKNMLSQNTSECFRGKESAIILIWCLLKLVRKTKKMKQPIASKLTKRTLGKPKRILKGGKNRQKAEDRKKHFQERKEAKQLYKSKKAERFKIL